MRTAFCIAMLAAGASATWAVCRLARTAGPSPNGAPSLRIADRVDFGESESGQLATAEIEIANDGAADLIVSGVRAACACTGLEERRPDGSFALVSTLTVPPGGRAQVFLRLAVNGPVGAPLNSVVHFLTNDPARPEVTIPVRLNRITHGARAVPEVVAFGIAPVGRPVVRTVDVVDRTPVPRAVSRMESANPSAVSATLVPVPEGEAAVPGGRVVARLKAEGLARAAGEADERVNVWLATDTPASPVSVRVTGRVAAPVEFSPRTLVLPLRSDAGPVYHGAVLCRAHGGAATLRVVDCPPGFVVRLPDPVAPGAPRLVAIERSPLGPRAESVQVRIGVTVDGVETTHPITVVCDP